MAHYHHVWSPKSRAVISPVEHWAEPVWRWLRAHVPHLRVIGIVVTLFVVAFGIVRGYSHFRESAAMQIFAQSAATEATPPKSILETLVQKYPHTAAGKYADWLLATQYYQEGNFAEAAKSYEALSERTPVHRLYHLIAAEGAGYAYEQQGNYTKAAEIFLRLSKISDNPFADQARQNAARNDALAAGLTP